MKQGQTFHAITCDCSFCKAGDTKFPILCGATFKEHCQYPECDCDRPVTSAVINSTEFPRLKNIPEEIMDVLDGPEQECYSIEVAHHVTNPSHGGKVTCHKCNGFIIAAEHEGYWSFQHRDEFPNTHFHKECFNEYEHYYGLDKPID